MRKKRDVMMGWILGGGLVLGYGSVALVVVLGVTLCSKNPRLPTEPDPDPIKCDTTIVVIDTTVVNFALIETVEGSIGVTVIRDNSPNEYQVWLNGALYKTIETAGGGGIVEELDIDLDELDIGVGVFDIEFKARDGDSKAAFTKLRVSFSVKVDTTKGGF